jgi:class 3 adenylate cyclase
VTSFEIDSSSSGPSWPDCEAPTGPRIVRGVRGQLTVLMTDLSDSIELAEQLEAEAYADLLGSIRHRCRRVIARHGGHVARVQGDGMLAVFGFPQASADAGRMATEAALELQQAVGALCVRPNCGPPRRLTLHSGIHSGHALVVEGSIETGRLDLFGDAPNTAARLCSLAAAGEICVSQSSLAAQASMFITHGSRSVVLRGRARPLAICRVLGLS